MADTKDRAKNASPLETLVAPLLDWYSHNARALPWRENTQPYRVWVSEIMLQQTRVEAVIPYYLRFLDALPTVDSLAAVEEEQLLKLWEGLGYYTRARNLRKAAQMIRDVCGGRFPDSFDALQRLPGVGTYTAGAIASIAFGLPVPAVDGNVLRVVARFTGDDRDITAPMLKAEYTQALAAVYPATGAGDFTQSLMELGAVVCLPNGAPQCAACPLADLCRANREQLQQALPVRTKKTARRQETKTVLLLRCGEQVAVRKRQAAGLLGGLWEFPNLPESVDAAPLSDWLGEQGITAHGIVHAGTATHIFTHVEWRLECWRADCDSPNGDLVWVTRNQLEEQLSLPTAFRKLCRWL